MHREIKSDSAQSPHPVYQEFGVCAFDFGRYLRNVPGPRCVVRTSLVAAHSSLLQPYWRPPSISARNQTQKTASADSAHRDQKLRVRRKVQVPDPPLPPPITGHGVSGPYASTEEGPHISTGLLRSGPNVNTGLLVSDPYVSTGLLVSGPYDRTGLVVSGPHLMPVQSLYEVVIADRPQLHGLVPHIPTQYRTWRR
eukprot:2399416-Rhodomonas_salina.1